MTNAHIARLDRSTAKNGEDIILRRVVGTTNQQNTDVGIRAKVEGLTDKTLIAATSQLEFHCIFSPTQINAAQWPGGQPPGPQGDDPRVPDKNRGDMARVRGKWRAVQWAFGKYPGGELVRIEMRVLG